MTSDLFKHDHCPIYQAARRFHSFVMSIIPGRGQRVLREQCERATLRAMFLLAESADADMPENVALAYRGGKAALHRTRVALQAAFDVGAIKGEQFQEALQMLSDLVLAIVPLAAGPSASTSTQIRQIASAEELAGSSAPPSPAPSPVPPSAPLEAPASSRRRAAKRPTHAKRPKPVWQAAGRASYGAQPNRAPSSRPLRVR